jgi:hypothetical protein
MQGTHLSNHGSTPLGGRNRLIDPSTHRADFTLEPAVDR